MTKEEKTQMLNELFGGIGRIAEEDDRFICYVDKKTIEDSYKTDRLYDLKFYGVPIKLFEQQNIDILEYRLNKPIYYVIDGFDFESMIKLSSYFDCKVIFKNCTFVDEIYILSCGDVEFENNTYKDDGYLYYGDPQYFLKVYLVNKLSFRNDNFINREDKKSKNTKFGMLIRIAKEVEFVSTRIDANFPTTINADRIRLENSTLVGTEFDITAKSIENKDSTIRARTGIMIDNPSCDFEGRIKAPIVIYNGEDVTNYNSTTTLVSKQQLLRVGLIDALDQIRKKSTEQIIEETLSKDKRGVGSILNPHTRKRVP